MPYTKTNRLNILQATAEAMAHELYLLAGYRKTRLSGAHAAGDDTVAVESAYLFTPTREFGIGKASDSQNALVSTHATPNLDQFGASAALDRKTLLIGASEVSLAGTGRVYLYEILEDGTPSLVSTLTAAAGAASDECGLCVAIEGDWIAIGAPGVGTDQGAVYVFKKENGAWSEHQTLTAADGAANDRLGASVAISGTTIITGAPRDTNAGGAAAGAAYVFSLDAATGLFAEQQKLLADDASAGDWYGTAVAIYGDTVAAGSPTGGSYGGAVYLSTRTAGVWTAQQKLVGNNDANDNFGAAVAMDGRTLAVGATYYAAGSTGKAFVFWYNGTVWGDKREIIASDEANLDNFGASVALRGPILAVGAPERNLEGVADVGAVYLFTRNNSTMAWTEQSKVTATEDLRAASQKVGTAVALGGKWLIAGGAAIAGSGSFETYLWTLREAGRILLEDETDPIGYVGMDVEIDGGRFLGCDLLTRSHRDEEEVIDWGRNASRLDMLRRATMVDYAESSDLVRIARNHAVPRLRGFTDDTFREVIKAIAYTYRGTIYAMEILLETLFPDQDWAIYEDRVNHPSEIFFTIPGQIGSNPLGRGYLNDRDDVTSASTSSVTVNQAPTTVESVTIRPIEQELAMTILPSAASPAWSYVAESAGAEGAYFSIASGTLVQAHPAGTDGGRYSRTIPELSTDYNSLGIMWYPTTLTTVGGYPWKLMFRDGEREYAMMWNETTVALGQADETIVSSIAVSGLTSGWHHMRLVRRDGIITANVNGAEVLSTASSLFSANGTTIATFGYTDAGNANEWSVKWDGCTLYTRNETNYWNLSRSDGAVTVADSNLASAAALFVVGDVGHPLWLEAANGENYGLWQVAAVPGAGTATLTGYVWRKAVYLDSLRPDRVLAYEPRFVALDAPKSIILSGSAVGNDDTYPVVSVISPTEIEVDITGHPGGLVTESNMAYAWDATFVNESNIPWTLVVAGTLAGAVLTLRELLPAATVDVRVEFSTVPSAILRRDETVVRGDSYPFYLQGVDERLQALIDSITAAGVIPRFERGY